MIKISVFNKINDSLIVDTFKNVFQRRSSEVFQPDIPEFQTIQKYMLHWSICLNICVNCITFSINNLQIFPTYYTLLRD